MPDVPSQPGVGASAVIRFGEALQLLETAAYQMNVQKRRGVGTAELGLLRVLASCVGLVAVGGLIAVARR